MKIKLIFSKYEESTGVSISTIRCKYGEFVGIARLHPGDKAIASSFLGCEIAEKRAIIKAFKARRREVVAMQKAIERVINDIAETKTYERNSPENRRLRKTYYRYQQELFDIDSQIGSLSASIDKKLEQREDVLKRFSK